MTTELVETVAVQFACLHIVVMPGEMGQEARRVYEDWEQGTCPRCGQFGRVWVSSVYVEEEAK